MENQQRMLRHQATVPAADDNYLAITVGGDAYAVALNQVHGLFADRKVAPLPGGCEYLGMSCLRGGIVGVYSLRAFLGYPPGDAPLNWLILTGESFALAFDDFDLYARAAGAEASVPATGRGGHVRSSVLIAGALRPVICLDSIAERVAVMP